MYSCDPRVLVSNNIIISIKCMNQNKLIIWIWRMKMNEIDNIRSKNISNKWMLIVIRNSFMASMVLCVPKLCAVCLCMVFDKHKACPRILEINQHNQLEKEKKKQTKRKIKHKQIQDNDLNQIQKLNSKVMGLLCLRYVYCASVCVWGCGWLCVFVGKYEEQFSWIRNEIKKQTW